jgi:HEPN domain-containing protein
MSKKNYLDFAFDDYVSMRLLYDCKLTQGTVIIHAQQCIEKLIKYVLLKKTGMTYNTHNLLGVFRKLYKVEGFDDSLKQYEDYLSTLGNYYFTLRYPAEEDDCSDDISWHDVDKAVKFVESAGTALLSMVGEEKFDCKYNELVNEREKLKKYPHMGNDNGLSL